MFGGQNRRWRPAQTTRIAPDAPSEQKRRRRMCDSGHVRLATLEAIGEQPRDGLDVVERVQARYGDLDGPSAGIVYPMLSLLEDQGFIAAREPPGERRRYTITRAGRLHLVENQPFLNAMQARHAPSHVGDGRDARSPGLREAFARLKHALVGRVRAGQHDAARLEKMREILTRAAREIEAL